jgi:hypothetical protein
MEFFIKKGANLPAIRLLVVQDGRSDYVTLMETLVDSKVFFSMANAATGIPKIALAPCEIIPFYQPDGTIEYYVNFKFSNRDTNKPGRYKGEFIIQNPDGTRILPLREEIFINVQDTFVSIDNCCTDTISDFNSLVLIVDVLYGSVDITYTLTSFKPVPVNVRVDFTNIFYTYVGSPLIVTTGVTINAGNTIGTTYVNFPNEDSNNLTRYSTISNIVIIPSQLADSYTITEEIIFPTPTPTPSVTPDVTPTPSITPESTTTPTPTPTITTTETPTPTITPTQDGQIITNAIITNDDKYISVGDGLYLMFIDPPTPTQTPTNTSTPTQTPTNTKTPTLTPTNTSTPTQTPTNTKTPTPTPTTPSLVTDGLVLYYDFSNPVSYSGSGVNIIDLSPSNNNGTVVNDYGHISYVSSGSTSYFNWDSNSGGNGGSNSFSGSIWTTSANTYLDFTMVLQPDFSIAGIGGMFCLPNDKSLRVYNNNWEFPNPGNGDDWASQPTTYYVNGQVSNQMVSGWNIIGGAKNNTNPAFPNNGILYVGTSGYNDRNMQGKIAVVLMYNRTLTGQEQIQNYNYLKTRFGL